MSRRRLLAIAIAAIAAAALAWYFWPTPGVTVAGVESQLRLRAPIGTTLKQVVAVLDSMRAQHSDGSNGLLTANFGQSPSRGLVTGEVFGTFHIDRQGRLASYELKEWFTGP